MKNHEEDLMLMSNFIIRELKQRKNTDKDFSQMIEGILPLLIRNCNELGILNSVKSMIKIIEKDKDSKLTGDIL
ncbi:MAG TPA: hypothetical protein DCM10_07605 [Xanthomarina gelatinilytica]|nr:hypothetical protein [Xanthomarina gelatinilytica]